MTTSKSEPFLRNSGIHFSAAKTGTSLVSLKQCTAFVQTSTSGIELHISGIVHTQSPSHILHSAKVVKIKTLFAEYIQVMVIGNFNSVKKCWYTC